MRYGLGLLMVLAALPAQAAITDYLGRSIVEVRLRANDVDLSDPSLFEIVETRTGTPLAMVDVRETLAHLYGLGRYQDVQVDAALRGDGVVLTYILVPARRVRRIVFEGSLGLSDSELRRIVVDRYGASPPVARAPQVIDTLKTLYRDRGYPRARVAAWSDVDSDPASGSLVFAIQSGFRATMGSIEVEGAPRETTGQLLDRLEMRTGDEYDGIALDARLARYIEDLQAQGFYEARAAQLPRFVNDDRHVNLVLRIDPGPHVEIVFTGDPLSTRERELLVPIAREHSVDEDLLEDSKFGIERYFRGRGYCDPRADYQRDTAGDVLRIVFTVARGPQCVLESAEVTGNTSISSSELSPLILMKGGEPFVESTAGTDAARIQGLYRQRGFVSVKVSPLIERGEPSDGVASVRVRLQITEGPRLIIQSIAFEGNSAIDTETLRQAVVSAPGEPYFEPQIAADADGLSVLYLNRGYQEIAIQPEQGLAAGEAGVNLRFMIHEGPQVLIDHILIVGNQRTHTQTIAREVQFQRDQPLSQQAEDDTRTRITALGLFRRVDISYLQLPGVLNHRDVVITVEEAPATTIGYGGGIEGGKLTVTAPDRSAAEQFQVAPRGFFEVSRRNLFGKDRTLNLFTRVSFTLANEATGGGGYGFNEYLARLTYVERRLFGTGFDSTVSGGIEQARRSSFDFNRRSGNVTIARRLSRTLAVSGRYGIDHTRLLRVKSNEFNQQDLDRLFPQLRLSAVSSSLIRDTRNDSIEPNRGALIGLDAELAARRIGSQVGFFKTFLQGFTYRSLGGPRIIGAFGARIGLATGFPRPVIEPGQTEPTIVDDLPASERFYAGGDTTVRGFALDRLGPLDPNGFPTGGHGLVIMNAELRMPLRGSFGAVVFVDSGNVFTQVDDVSLGELRGAVGFGIRYRSPVGPIRVDLGIKLDRRVLPNGSREGPTALHISLGQAF
ncbi:MAG: outer membrane protein assembly factor [Acidobacteria bacterium]|nr:outer membrane protein assembly factor [Acidobacteriota bacterium]